MTPEEAWEYLRNMPQSGRTDAATFARIRSAWRALDSPRGREKRQRP